MLLFFSPCVIRPVGPREGYATEIVTSTLLGLLISQWFLYHTKAPVDVFGWNHEGGLVCVAGRGVTATTPCLWTESDSDARYD